MATGKKTAAKKTTPKKAASEKAASKKASAKKASTKKAGKDDPCWDGYDMVGMKNKNGKEVPNCVPEQGTKKK